MPPPGGGNKRKRGDRSYSGDDFQRPSPHRPGNLNLAQQQSSNYGREYSDNRGRGGRRPSRGGRNSSYHSSPTNARPKDPINGPPQTTSQDRTEADKPLNGRPSTPEPPQPLREPSSPPVDHTSFNFEFLTEDIRDTWATGGQESISRQGIEAVSNEDDETLEMLMQELIHAVLAAQIPIAETGAIIRQIFAVAADDDMSNEEHVYPSIAQAAFLDTLCVIAEGSSTTSLSRLARLISATEISQDLLRQELDAPLLEKLGLIRNTFARMGIRKQTNVLYRQANFNLMREESEGFAKLMTELFTTSGNEPPSGEVVGDTVEKVKAMIGAFDLDVGRSLDVVLDVFGAVLVKQFRFFVKFLRASPWWPRDVENVAGYDLFAGLPMWALPDNSDWHLTEEQKDDIAQQSEKRDINFWERARGVGLQAYFELGCRGASDQERPSKLEDESETFKQEWMNVTGTLPRVGNKDAAQLLGFKLRFYSSSNARDENDVLPDNLIYLSALLIKIGFISLGDLYPHIWRSDEDMEELRQQKLKEKADREKASRPGAGMRNALLMAGALADDTMPIPSRLREGPTRAGTPSRDTEAEKPTAPKDATPERADQKVLLFKSLLAIGALPEALFILGKFPWLLDLYPEVPDYFHRILHHSLSHVYASLQPMADRDSLQSQKPTAETEISGLPKGQVRLTDPPVRKTLRWALLDRMDSTDGLDYQFYWDQWNDNVPVCRTMEDAFTLCNTFLDLVGIKIGHDPTLLLKIARIGRFSMQQNKSDSNRARWLDLSKRFLLPALSLTKSNAGVVNEVFEMINSFPINTRFLMYLEWTSGKTSRLSDIKTATDQARAETKDVLKRISKTNVRPMARALAKIAYANPHIVITTAIAQIEVYDSIADVFVEGARYFTDLGYDVLTWAMISSMGREGRSRTRQGGLFTSKWLSALATFAGKLFKRYNIMRPGPLLQYVEEQLSRGNSTDLIMLEQLISSMAGIASDLNFNDAQLQAMGGGELLQAQTLIQVLDRRHESKITSRRLMRSLRENGLTGTLLISLAQQRQACIYENEYSSAPLKLLGMVFDDINQVLVQYLESLRSNLTFEEFANSVPSLSQLILKFQMPPEVAFWISRSTLSRQMTNFDMKKKLDDAEAKDLPNGDIDMTDEINSSADEEDGEEIEGQSVTDAAATPTPAEISGSAMEVEHLEKQESTETDGVQAHWHPVLGEIMEAINPSLPQEVFDIIGSGFYVTFWQLSAYEIAIPGKSYEDELSRQNKRINIISNDRSDVSIAGNRKREEAKKQVTSLVDRLLDENKQHLKAFAESKARLSREKDQWFAGKGRIYEQLNSALMEQCFLPRLLFSPLDAYFCFKFIKFLHAAGTPNFRTLGFYDLIFKQDRLTSLIFASTAKEADNLGRFLCEMLRDLGRWHQNKAIYEKEAFGIKRNLPGFAMKLDAQGKPSLLLNYEEFRRILYKWHQNVANAMSNCLSSSEYMHVRNAISVLRAVSLHFPAINYHGTKLVDLLKKLGEDGTREDLQLASKAVMGALHRREKLWMIPQAFKKGQEKNESRVEGGDDKTLNAPTAEFKPAIRDSEVPKSAAEDGELADIAMTDAPKSETQPKAEQIMSDVAAKLEMAESKAASLVLPSRGDSRTPAAQAVAGTNGTRADPKETQQSASQPRPHDLPKRMPLSPAQRPPSLPSRPEPSDSRSGYRDGGRMPPRPPQHGDSRHLPDSRPTSARHRPDDRHHDSFERPPYRGQERELGRAPRDEYHGRSERDRNVRQPEERHRPQDREAAPSSYDSRSSRPRPEDTRTDRAAPPSQAQPSARPASSQSESVTVNPERAALIEQGLDRPNISIRGQAQERSARAPRPQSLPRNEPNRTEPPRHEREADRPPRVPESQGRSNPLSSRSERSSHDSRQQYPPRQIDMQHGRLEQDFSHTTNNSRPDVEVPSGPRGRGPPPQRNLPPVNTQMAAERPPPTGPARPHTRSNSHAEPATPASDASGVHPDRLKLIPAEPARPSVQSPPLGPRGNAPAGAPSGPSPTTLRPPSGPQNPNEVSVRGQRRHPLAAVNNTLQQAQGPSSRGRGGRQPSGVNSHIGPSNGQPDLFAQSNGSSRDQPPRGEEERRPSRRNSPERVPRADRERERPEEPRRNTRREDDDRRRDERRPREDGPLRKHVRGEEGYGRGGGRVGSDSKRVRRGG